ncbi:MAG: M61 family metallopeptidase [Parvularculaceae bacterium]
MPKFAAVITPAALMLTALAAPGFAQTGASVRYEVAFPNVAHHEARITVTYEDVAAGPLRLRMSRSSPGRYAIHEFAKNVYAVSAVDGRGRPLAVTRDDPYSWEVSGHDGTVSATYTLYADRADGTYSQIDRTHAHFNMPSAFMWAEGYGERPIEIEFEPASRGWKVATQLEPTRNRYKFRAPDLYYFLDSPTELSDFDLREWRVGEGRERQTIRLAVHHDGSEDDVDRYAEMAKNIVAEQIELFGEAPRFDYGTYTFIACYLPHVNGDGMEHRNSTILTSTRSLADAEFSQLGTLSHEFIHAWNVERLRPAELEPFDFTRANPTPSLWFAEGFTSYYGPLTIRRAGEWTRDRYIRALSGTVNFIVTSPARRFAGPAGMSLRAPFVDAATAIDPTNNANIFLSYYPYGAVIGLALDLTLRTQFDGLTLDGYMRHMWRRNGAPEIPYTMDDLRDGLAELTGDRAFADAFFDQYVMQGGLPDLATLLDHAGLILRKRNEGAAWLGAANFDEADGALVISSNTIIGAPLYEAGLDRGDAILRIGDDAIGEEADFDEAVAKLSPGDRVEIVYRSRDGEHRAELTAAEDGRLEIVTYESAGRALSAEQAAFRAAWLGEE